VPRRKPVALAARPSNSEGDRSVLRREHRLLVLVAMAGILLLGGYLRLVGLDWDEGQHLHPDERFLTMVENALAWPESLGEYLDSSVNPLNPYNRGQGSYVYGLLPVTLAKFIGQATGHTGYWGVYLAGRAMSAILDLLAVVVVFFLGRRLYDTRVGLLGALLLAMTVLNIQQSHYFTVDSATTFLVTTALYAAVRVSQGESLGSVLGLGLAFGLAISAKISVATFGLIIGLALLVRVFGRGSQGGNQPDGRVTRTGRMGRWRFTLALDDDDAPLSVRRLDGVVVRWLRAAVLMIAILFIAFWAFRLAQPQAFQGPGLFGLQLNQRWLDDMRYIQRLMSGEIDYPPSHQWADRAPVTYMLENMVKWGLGLPLGLAVCFAWGLMGWQLLRHGQLRPLLPWSWMTLTFLYQSVQFVKTVRYLLPIYPTMALMAAAGLVWLWDRARSSARPRATALAGVICGTVVLGTALWAFSFASIYTRPVTRIEASRWIYANIPPGSALTFEVWDDALPLNLDGRLADQTYTMVRTDPYWEDIPEKRTALVEWLDQADYIILSSNRLYGSIPRLPSRYPMTTRYYEALFSGELGYEMLASFTSRPQLFGIEIVDDDADESFTVYDHPRVTVFRKTAAYSTEAVQALFADYDLERIVRIMPKQVTGAPDGLMLRADELRSQRQGGTWSDLFDRKSLVNRVPVLVWYLAFLFVAVLAFPLAFPALRQMPDGGYLLAKAVGLLLVGYVPWMLVSLGVATFSRGTLWLSLMGLSAVSALAAWAQRRDLVGLLRKRWRLLVVSEGLFLIAFVGMILIRHGNPDLWHGAMGGEKPMDLAYLNAIIKSTTFPPYDPWFSGGHINYYYYGWLPIAVVIKLTGILPTVGYNLALATLFALVFAGSASVAAYLMPRCRDDADGAWLPSCLRWGLVAGVLVAVAGNLGEIELLWQGLAEIGRRGGSALLGEVGQVLRGLLALLQGHEALAFRPEWWYWNASRIMSHGEINEFPFFSFLYGDLHAHVVAMPLFVLGVGVAANLASGGSGPPLGVRRTLAIQIGLLALVLGASWCANTWDLPTGLAIAAGALVIRARDRIRVRSRQTIVALVSQLAAMGALAWLLYFPFHARYGAAYSSVGLWSGERSSLGDLVLIYLPFLFVLITYLLQAVRPPIVRSPWWRSLRLGLARQPRFGRGLTLRRALVRYPTLFYGLGWLVCLLMVGAVALLIGAGEVTSALLFILLALGVLALFAGKAGSRERFLRLMVVGGLALSLGLEWVVLDGDIGRMNTVFKFSLQVWILWGISTAVALRSMLAGARESGTGVTRRAWWRVVLAALLAGTLSYPALAAPAKVRDRISASSPTGLDGMAFMDSATYQDNGQQLNLGHDAEAIRWLQEHVLGSPVIVEANTPLYRWGGRVSVYTGLPSVVGWDWHQKQQRAALSSTVVDWRLQDLATIYTSLSVDETVELLRRYQVGLIYVGELERAYYAPEALAKFDAMLGDTLERIYSKGPVTIYRVLGSGARLTSAQPAGPGWVEAARDWLARHWIPSRVRADGDSSDARLLLESPVEDVPSVNSRGWNTLAEGSPFVSAALWWLVLVLIGLIVWPLILPVFGGWSDGGYLVAKGLGLVLVGYVAWLAMSLRWLRNTPLTAWGAALMVGAVALAVYVRRRRRFSSRFSAAAMRGEAVFALSYGTFVLIRMLNPDLWQPWYGGEKMMEIAMLNAISRSAYLPPYDPYFAGGVLNYYYYGLYLVSLLCKMVGLSPEIGFNLAVPTFFGLTVSHAFAFGREIIGTGRLRIWQGAGSAALVAVAGNLSGARQIVQQLTVLACPEGAGSALEGAVCAVDGAGRWISGGGGALAFDYWYAATRIIPNTINEFPFFSYLFADLHPHMMALPLGLLVLCLCGALIQAARPSLALRACAVLWLALTIGTLSVTNTWDLPVFWLLSAATLVYLGYRSGGVRGAVLGGGVSPVLALAALLAFAPFYSRFRAQNLGLALLTPGERTAVAPFLEIWGAVLWLTIGLLRWGARTSGRRRGRRGSGRGRWLSRALGIALSISFAAGVAMGQIWPLLACLLAASLAMCILQRNRPGRWILWLCLAAGFGLLLGIEWIYVADFLRGSDWRRMNTVFKFSIQAWVLLAAVGGAMLPVVWQSARPWTSSGMAWRTGAVVLLAGAFVYPLAAVPTRVNERFPSGSPSGLTLDGTAYMEQAVYSLPESDNPVEMRYDRDALRWIWANVSVLPVLAEAPVGYYREGGLRMSSYSGLPTLVGAHQYEQRPAEQVAPQLADAELLFTTEDPEVALALMQRRHVRLVYVGPLERALYPEAALAKFEALEDTGVLKCLYENDGATLYLYADGVPGDRGSADGWS